MAIVKVYPNATNFGDFMRDFENSSLTEVRFEVLFGSTLPYQRESEIKAKGWSVQSNYDGTYTMKRTAPRRVSRVRIGPDMYSLQRFINDFEYNCAKEVDVVVTGGFMTGPQREKLKEKGWSVLSNGDGYTVKKDGRGYYGSSRGCW